MANASPENAGVGRVVYFDDYQDSDGTFRFTGGCHFEHYKVFAEASVGSPTALRRFLVQGASMIQNGTGAMNARQQLVNISGAQISDFTISDSTIVGSWTFTNPGQVNLNNNRFLGNSVSISGGEQVVVSANQFFLSVALSGVPTSLAYTGNSHAGGGALTDTTTGNGVVLSANSFASTYTQPSIAKVRESFLKQFTNEPVSFRTMDVILPTTHSGGLFTIPHGGTGILDPGFSYGIAGSVNRSAGARTALTFVSLDGTNLMMQHDPATADASKGRRARISWRHSMTELPTT